MVQLMTYLFCENCGYTWDYQKTKDRYLNSKEKKKELGELVRKNKISCNKCGSNFLRKIVSRVTFEPLYDTRMYGYRKFRKKF